MAAGNVVSSAAKSKAGELLAYGQRQVDRVVSPFTRQQAYDWVRRLAIERPILFSFVSFQLFLSAVPLFLFISFATSTVAFALVAAVVFILFWVGVATLFLVPTLFLTFSVALLLWTWSAAAFFSGRWIYSRLPSSPDGKAGGVKLTNGVKKVKTEADTAEAEE
ncbi:hypothetical protein GGS23DRAFT_594771 [Durotheca rogersii]|uniref:uncharacterized protein n=1 Tax=Durotheca rogersii TaxID=419775 RepID=UPI00222056C6|nr:uncharacterized protein GGS23DRAFT_594771 [Durotheca rogersii]KAI5865226.1 hypothetical protein GGS23DRAFT_594771 [Durotheca rogersii]